jgi:ketosteroid isomerase-like protein
MFHRSRFGSATTALLLAACASAPIAAPDDSLEGLFAAERSFAKASTERGIRASFLEYFAVDGVNFQPGPGSMRERLLAHPSPADPLALLLDWSPQAGAVARSDDLGFTTGPYSLRNQRDATAPTRYGYFFSVWKRENGTWRVAVDAGVSTPAAPEPEARGTLADASGQPPRKLVPAANWHGHGKEALLALEREPRSLDSEPAGTPSYFELLASSVRLLREGSYAVLGADAVRKTLTAPMQVVSWTPTGAGAAASDDLGYTYGSYVRTRGLKQEAAGYYVHVWQRDEAGGWRIAVEVLLPPE